MQYKSIKLFLSLLFFLLYSFYPVISLNGDTQVLLQVKSDQLHDSDGKLSNWVPISEKSPCNWLGITCDTQNRSVVGVDLSGLGISGGFPNGLCRIRTLKNLTLTENSFNGTLSPQSLSPCSHLQVLELSSNYFTGELPDLSREFTSLQVLDLHDNNFFGDIPASFGRFPALKVLNLGGNYIDGSIPWFLSNLSELTRLELGYNPFKPRPLPPSYGNLSKLEILWLARANLVGEIPESIGKLVSLTNLDLSDNFLSGEIPHSIGGLTSVVQIELYNNNLFGELPESLVNLTALLRFDVSQNNLTGTVSHNIASMSLQSLNLNDNHFTGEIPEILASNPNLSELKLFNNSFSGKLPENLGKYNNLEDFDVSTNDFTGELPEFLCHRNKLQHLVVFNNRFSGKLPESYGECQPLYYVRMGNNKLSGELSTKFWGLPRLEFLEMYNNNFNGPISPSISRARNLTHLLISGNNFSGQIPSVICNLRQLLVFNIGQNGLSGEVPSCITHLNKLQKLDLHQNMFTGDLPGRLNLLTDLTELNLSNNRFTGKIPPKLGNLLVLAHLDLSNNMLTGEIPVELTKLKLNQFNISHNRLYGKVPSGFDNLLFVSSLLGNPGLCSPNLKLLPPCRRTKPDSVYFASILAICAMLTLGSLIWFTKTKSYYISKPKRRWKVTTFQKIGFSEDDIIPHLTEENIIGSGASGQVYRVKLKTGETVAVKKLWSSKLKLDTESVFKSETDTLGRIRHGNIIKLLLCCSDEEYRILVYEYMENGSLGDVLHGERGGAGLQDWYRRFTIAVGAAQGLAYLHHDCVRTIVHRDVKSNNILLDAEMVPHLADFGLAKTLGEDDGSMSRLAGSYGYIAPEYAYTSKVNEKSDVYSFGILLMELITGKRPNDACFGENKDIVKWVTEAALSSCLERETTANESNCCRDLRKFVDPRLEQSTCDYEEIEKVLKVALLCTSSFPFNRPSMRSVVELLNAKGHKLTCPK